MTLHLTINETQYGDTTAVACDQFSWYDGTHTTSGDYERFFVIEGQTFSHIMDPKTGKPVKDARSVTVIGENATVADAAATAVSVALHKKEAVEKIMENFRVKIYTLSGEDSVLKEW